MQQFISMQCHVCINIWWCHSLSFHVGFLLPVCLVHVSVLAGDRLWMISSNGWHTWCQPVFTSQLYCFSQHDCLCLEHCMQLACCMFRQMKVELRIYFWTVVKHSFSKQCPPLERHYHHDVTYLKSDAFSIFSVWMDSNLPHDLFRIFQTPEVGKKSWPLSACPLRQIDQPVAVPHWGYLYGRGGNSWTVLMWADLPCVAFISL